jgi:hypothetical protein
MAPGFSKSYAAPIEVPVEWDRRHAAMMTF